VDDAGIGNPLRVGKPHERLLLSGEEAKWCGLCVKWGDHYRADHCVDNEEEDPACDGDGYVAIEVGWEVITKILHLLAHSHIFMLRDLFESIVSFHIHHPARVWEWLTNWFR